MTNREKNESLKLIMKVHHKYKHADQVLFIQNTRKS